MDSNYIEQAVLATLIQNPECYHEHSNKLCKQAFYNASHQLIFEAIVDRILEDDCDLVTVTQYLRNKNYIPSRMETSMVAEIGSMTIGYNNLGNYIEHLDRQTNRSKLCDLHSKISDMLSQDSEPSDIINEIESFSETYYKESDVSDGVAAATESFLNDIQTKDSKEKFFTGFAEVDRVLGGIDRSDLVIVAGVTSMGKTSFVLNAAHNMILSDKAVGIFSLEMTSPQLISRMCASDAKVELNKIRYKDFSERELGRLKESAKKITDSKLYIDSKASSLSQVAAKINKWVKVNKVEIVVIDYLQLVRGSKSGSREQEVASVVRHLKNIAKQHNIAIIALSQLSRKVDAREGNKTPQLGDLRESGEIEQAADTVIFLYRPDYYDIDKATEYIHETQVIVAKGRNSGTGKGNVMFIPKLTKFCDEIALS